MEAKDLFVFAGAGVSCGMPAGLPTFNWLRDEILRQLELDAYIATANVESAHADVAEKMAPEAFMSGLHRSAIDVSEWLAGVLGRGSPNAVHVALARLARDGSRVWTVNFDTLIEEAGGRSVDCVSWPAEPRSGASILKPHGTINSRLIVTAEDVIGGLDASWARQLREDVNDRIVAFVGYRGRDLDFQPIWPDVLADAKRVLWFDFHVKEEQDRKQRLLAAIDQAGNLEFPPHAFPPAGVPAAHNPSWDFIEWCVREGLLEIDDALVAQLFEKQSEINYPEIRGARREARGLIAGVLGDYRTARNTYFKLLVRLRRPSANTRALLQLVVNQGGRPVAVALKFAHLLPPTGRLMLVRTRAERQRLTALHRLGSHHAVLRGTSSIGADTISTLLILRSAALRVTGSLDEAADLGAEAFRRATSEEHPVRVAHAAFQHTMALLWADRLDEARVALEEELVPRAPLAATRWVAWADFLRGALEARGDTRASSTAAFEAFELSKQRFEAEVLMDGVISVLVARLAVHRRVKDRGFEATAAEAQRLSRRGRKASRLYARRSRFTAEAIQIERAEYARIHEANRDKASRLYGGVASSPYPLHRSLALLGLAMSDPRHDQFAARIAEAKREADLIGARLVSARALQLQASLESDSLREVFFC